MSFICIWLCSIFYYVLSYHGVVLGLEILTSGQSNRHRTNPCPCGSLLLLDFMEAGCLYTYLSGLSIIMSWMSRMDTLGLGDAAKHFGTPLLS